MSVEVMELFNIFSKTFSKEDAQLAVKDIETLISDHKRELSTKEDIRDVKGDIREVELKLTKEIKEVELKLTKEIEEVELKLTKEIEQVKSSTIKWVVGWMVALIISQTGVIITIFTLLK
jgi:hypothetical protein